MMNNCNKLIEQAENLKKAVSNGHKGLNGDGSISGDLVSHRTDLQDVYRQLLITNLEFALDKKIEQDLWNFVFKNNITALQQQVKDKSNAFRTEAQSQLTSFLDASSGFYSHLLHDLCQTFHVNIHCRVPSAKLLVLKDSVCTKKKSITQPEKPSCQYMCQHCLVHLGDIARYRNQINQAESYYRHAAQLVPSNGQPYNQLAILAAASGDVLSTAFYYCRSLAVKCPFPGSDTNLRRQLTKIMGGDEPRHVKISTSELVKFCLKFHACIYLKQNSDKLSSMVEKLSGYVRAHLRAGSLSRQQMTHMTFLNLFSLNHLAPTGVNENGIPVESTPNHGDIPLDVSDTQDEESANVQPPSAKHQLWSAIITFTMHMLGGLLACVPAHSDEVNDLDHPALPAIKLNLDWLVTNPPVFHLKEVISKSRVWPRLAKVLNALGCQDKVNSMDNFPLPEDLEVRGFVGLREPLLKLNFAAGLEKGIPEELQHSCRSYRLYGLGEIISKINPELLTTCNEDNCTTFSSNVPLSLPGRKVNGVDEKSDVEDLPSPVDEDKEVLSDVEILVSPKIKTKDHRTDSHNNNSAPNNRRARSNNKHRGNLKNSSNDHEHTTNMRKAKNRAPRMQKANEDKLKAIKEEDAHGGNDNASESGGTSAESSQNDNISPGSGAQMRSSGHRVTFAPPPHISPVPYPHEESPSPNSLPGSYVDPNTMIPAAGSNSMYPDQGTVTGSVAGSGAGPQPMFHPQAPFIRNPIHAQQQPGSMFHPPGVTLPSNLMIAGNFSRRMPNTFPFGPNMMASQPRMAMPSSTMPQLQQPTANLGQNPPHPGDLPKPSFQNPMYQMIGAFRPFDELHHQQHNNAGDQGKSRQINELLLRPHQPPQMSKGFPDMPNSNQQQQPPSTFAPGMQARFPIHPSQQLSLEQIMQAAHGHGMHGQPQEFPTNMTGPAAVNIFQPPFPPFPSQQQPQPGNTVPHQAVANNNGNNLRPVTSSAGGSNQNSSTSSPTPGSGVNPLISVGSPQPPNSVSTNTFAGNQYPTNIEKRQDILEHPAHMGATNHFDLPKEQSAQIPPSQLRMFAKLAGMSPTAGSQMTDGMQQVYSQAPPSEPTQSSMKRYPPFAHDRQKQAFENAAIAIQAQQGGNNNPGSRDSRMQNLRDQQQRLNQVFPPFGKAEDPSYKLFPEDSPWGIGSGSKDGSLGLTGLGSIGSERAAAAQQNHQQFSPWRGVPPPLSNLVPTSTPAAGGGGTNMNGASGNQTLVERQMEMYRNNINMPPASHVEQHLSQQQQQQQLGGAAAGGHIAPSNPAVVNDNRQQQPQNNQGSYNMPMQSQSFWSTPMMPSGPSALEQLIRQQKQQSDITYGKPPT